MPLPFILGAATGFGGVIATIRGRKKMKEAKETMQAAESRHNKNIAEYEKENKETTFIMDNLGKLELAILKDFEFFSDTIEKIQERPIFEEFIKEDVKIPKYDMEELKKASIGAGALLGGLAGATLGTASGFAVLGVKNATIKAFGNISKGIMPTPSLFGVAAALGGGGSALGNTFLGAATAGVGPLVGGVIFNFTGEKILDKAKDAYKEIEQSEKIICDICDFLKELKTVSENFFTSLDQVNQQYGKRMKAISYIVNDLNKTDWNEFTNEEKVILENLVLLVGLLYKMCQVELIKKTEEDDDINYQEVNEVINDAKIILKEVEDEK